MSSFAVYNGVHYVYCSLFYFTEITDHAFVYYGFFFLCLTASTYFVNGITVTAHEWPTVALPRVYGTEGSRITLTG